MGLDETVKHNADAVTHDLGDSHIVWDTAGARGDSQSWAQAHAHGNSHDDKSTKQHHVAAKKNAVHNSDGAAKKTAAAKQTVSEDVTDEHSSTLNMKMLAVYGMAGLSMVVMVVATMQMVKRRAVESVEIPAIPPSTQVTESNTAQTML